MEAENKKLKEDVEDAKLVIKDLQEELDVFRSCKVDSDKAQKELDGIKRTLADEPIANIMDSTDHDHHMIVMAGEKLLEKLKAASSVVKDLQEIDSRSRIQLGAAPKKPEDVNVLHEIIGQLKREKEELEIQLEEQTARAERAEEKCRLLEQATTADDIGFSINTQSI